MSTFQIDGKEEYLNKIFSSEYTFSIPRYQRPYSWKTDHVEDLLDDILDAMGKEENPEINELNPYFLGTIVLIKKKGSPQATIVDGQQRITSLMILLSVMRCLSNVNTKKHLATFLYEPGNPYRGTSTHYRLSVRERDNQFFSDYFLEEDKILELKKLDESKLNDSERNMRDNAIFLYDKLFRISKKRRDLLAKYVPLKCLMVVVSATDQNSAYRIFSILNDRGLNLSHSDILKAEIIGEISNDDQEEYAEKWEEQEENLGRDHFDNLFGYIRTIYRKIKQQSTILEEFREYVIKKIELKNDIIDNVIVPYANTFDEIRNLTYTSTKNPEKINNIFKWLNKIDNSDWIPPALVYFKNNEMNEENLLKFFIDLERLAVGLMILRFNINKRIERYALLLDAIESDRDLYSQDSPLQLKVDEKQEIIESLNGDFYHKSFRTYVMLRIDETISGGGAQYDHPIISVEHVLPQTPKTGSQWEVWFPDEELREEYVHRLGNLVLLSRRKNSSARNYDFNTKKTRYFSGKGGISPFAITTRVLNESSWTQKVIDKNQIYLIGKASNLWRLV